MSSRLDEHGLTPKKKMFVDEYCLNGNLYKSYCMTHVVNELTKKASVENQASKLIREPQVAAYLKVRRDEQATRLNIDADYVAKALLSVVEQNPGKACSIRAAELLGKMQGHFWEKPAKKLGSDITMDNNTKATKQILNMMKEGLITEESASAWIQSIDQKSKLEERENTNKEILEKLNTINSAMEKKIDE